MDKELWTAVDQYTTDRLLPPDPALEAALQASEAAGLPPISVSPSQGKMLMLLAQLAGASRILEIGTLGGYSSIWLARALKPGGRLITLEANPKHAKVAGANIAHAGLASVVEVRLGVARAGIQQLVADEHPDARDLCARAAARQTRRRCLLRACSSPRCGRP